MNVSSIILFSRSTLGYLTSYEGRLKHIRLLIQKQALHYRRSTNIKYLTYIERVESMYFARVHSPLGLKTPHGKRVDESKGQVTNNQEERRNWR